jgi:hypothetical protein
MRALAIVTARELRALAPTTAALAATAALPWLAPLLPGVANHAAGEVRLATGLALAALLGFALSLFVGSGLLARDLAEGRLGFFLALPLSARAIWGGRVLAATVLVYGGMALVALPVALAAGPDALATGSLLYDLRANGLLAEPLPLARALAVGVLLFPLALILLAHQLATALRARSPWLLLDLAGLALSAALFAQASLRLAMARAPVELALGALAAGALALATLLAGGGLALARGGTLLSRVHRAQAVTVSAGLVGAALVSAGWSSWVVRVDAADVTAVEAAEAAPSGSWLLVSARARHRPSYRPWILADTRDGASPLTLAGSLYDRESGAPPPLAFAADGKSALLARPVGAGLFGPRELVRVDIAGKRAQLVPTGIQVERFWAGDTALLTDGRRFAVAEPTRLTVWGDDGRAALGSAALPRAVVHWQAMCLAGDRLRLVRFSGDVSVSARVEGWELDLTQRRLRALGTHALAPDQPMLGSLSPDGERLLLARDYSGRGGIVLLDVATGTALAPLTDAAHRTYAAARFLADGRVVVARAAATALTVRIFDRDGTLLREVPAGAGRWAVLGGEWRPGAVVFTALVPTAGKTGRAWRQELREVDLATGAVRALGEGLVPVSAAAPWYAAADAPLPAAPATRLFQRSSTAGVVRLAPGGAPQALLPVR